MATNYNYMGAPQVKTTSTQQTQQQPRQRDNSFGVQGFADNPMTTTSAGTGRQRDDMRPGDYVGPAQGGSSWNLPQWNSTTSQPSMPNTYKPPNPAGQGGAEAGFFGIKNGDTSRLESIFNPGSYTDENSQYARYMASALPVAQFGQNNFQYRNDFNEAQRRWEAEFGATQGQNQFQQQLSARQQMSAEEQARLAAAQWNQQFGHTQYMDKEGLGLTREQIANQFRMGMDENQATRDVAGIQAGANRYAADIYSGAQRYGADQSRIADMYGADRGVDVANVYGGAQRYQADQGLAGQLGSANIYSGAQRYGADQELAAAKYQWDMQQRINAAMMANNLQVANISAYGRSQAPNTQWARSWA